MLEQFRIADSHLGSVCKYRQGKDTCRYIVYLDHFKDFFCAKGIPHLKHKIDAVVDRMKAQGDNCEGLNV